MIVPINNLGRRIQVGDTVVVRGDLQVGKQYRHGNGDKLGVVLDMMKHRGMHGVVTKVQSYCYRIDEFGSWGWVDGMLSGAVVPDVDDLSECAECNIGDLFSV